MSAKTIDERLAEATDNLRTDGMSAQAQRDYFDVMGERDRDRKAVVAQAISDSGLELTAIEARAVDIDATLYIDGIDDEPAAGAIREPAKLALLRRHVDQVLSSPMRLKVVVAVELEAGVHDLNVDEDGILSRALDEVIGTLTPYARSFIVRQQGQDEGPVDYWAMLDEQL